MKLIVNKHSIELKKEELVNEGEYNVQKCLFEFSQEYSTLTKYATFTNCNGSYKVVVVNNQCDIPIEILRDRETFTLGVYGYYAEDDELKLRLSPAPVYVTMEKGSYVEDAMNTEKPTPTDLEQIQTQVTNNRNDIDTLKEKCINYDSEIEEIQQDIVEINGRIDTVVSETDAKIESINNDISRLDQEQETQNTDILNNTNAINEINGEIETINTNLGTINSNIQTIEGNISTLESTTQSQGQSISALETNLSNEITNRNNGDINLQEQIDGIVASSDVKDIVGTHQELEDYDTSTLGNNDIIKVLQDETHEDAMTYYRWLTASSEFNYIGQEGPYYTKSEIDTTLQPYVKNTDYATNSKGGVFKTSSAYATRIENGYLEASEKTYNDYQNLDNNSFVGKGTLENVITGKGLTTKQYVDDNVETINQAFEDLEGTFTQDQERQYKEIADLISLIDKETSTGTNTLSYDKAKAYKVFDCEYQGNTKQDTSILPSEYQQVEYIESTGTQYIDTGLNADTKLRTILDISFIDPTRPSQTMGAINVGTPNKRYHIFGGSNSMTFWVNDGNYNIINTASTDRHLWDLNVPEGKVVIDKTTTTTIPTNIDDTELNFWLFARNSNSSQYKALFKLWACKMYYNGELVRDYIPCYRKSDNVIGLYDLVNKAFVENAGTGAFNKGSDAILPNPDYPQEVETLKGYNLFDEITTKQLIASDGTISSNSNWNLSDYIEVEPNTQYTFERFDGTQQSLIVGEYSSSKEFIKRDTQGQIATNTPYVITTSSTTKYLRVNYNNTFETTKLQLSKGISKPYLPYNAIGVKRTGDNGQERIDYIDLQDNELLSTDKIVKYDEVVKDDDGNVIRVIPKLKLVKNWGKVVLDGRESWQKVSAQTGNYYYFYSTLLDHNAKEQVSNLYCNKFKTYDGQIVYNTPVNVDTINLSNTSTNSRLRLLLLNSRIASYSVADLRNWLSTNNVEVYYPLATPQEIDLGTIEPIRTLNGQNNVEILATLEPTTMSETYAYDLRKELETTEWQFFKAVMGTSSNALPTTWSELLITSNVGGEKSSIDIYKEQLVAGDNDVISPGYYLSANSNLAVVFNINTTNNTINLKTANYNGSNVAVTSQYRIYYR